MEHTMNASVSALALSVGLFVGMVVCHDSIR